MNEKDLTFGEDLRGDYGLFIHARHFLAEWELDAEAQEKTQELTYFRVINGDGSQGHHGWAENGKIVQWG